MSHAGEHKERVSVQPVIAGVTNGANQKPWQMEKQH